VMMSFNISRISSTVFVQIQKLLSQFILHTGFKTAYPQKMWISCFNGINSEQTLAEAVNTT
ncbi:hypothetical protein, partial [Vibrio sp. V19_P1S1T109]|uniref:hypothetical protein n=1 Tax=Vibrio sp. V19_P1S1T109 TaxID=1938672 RepID=UPI001C3CB5B4